MIVKIFPTVYPVSGEDFTNVARSHASVFDNFSKFVESDNFGQFIRFPAKILQMSPEVKRAFSIIFRSLLSVIF